MGASGGSTFDSRPIISPGRAGAMMTTSASASGTQDCQWYLLLLTYVSSELMNLEPVTENFKLK